MPVKVIVFTDLDGTLLDSQTYSYDDAKNGLNLLRIYGIPLIPVTSKTRAEAVHILRKLNFPGPAIVENGCAIVFTEGKAPDLPEVEYFEDGMPFIRIAGDYRNAVTFLKNLSNQTGIRLIGFNDMTPEEIAKLSGLPIDSAQRSKKREFCETFVKPPEDKLEEIKRMVRQFGYKVLIGDRFCHLVKAEADKGKAIEKYLKIYKLEHGDDVITIGLGNSPNDIEMLEVVDMPIVIPYQNGAHPDLLKKNWRVARYPGPKGWADAIEETLKEIGIVKRNFQKI